MITLQDALKQMDNKDAHGKAVPFSIEFWTADRKKKTGGELIKVDSCILARNQKKEKGTQASGAENKNSKAQNHWENSTRNILILSSNRIRKCHIRLIENFNGKKVLW